MGPDTTTGGSRHDGKKQNQLTRNVQVTKKWATSDEKHEKSEQRSENVGSCEAAYILGVITVGTRGSTMTV